MSDIPPTLPPAPGQPLADPQLNTQKTKLPKRLKPGQTVEIPPVSLVAGNNRIILPDGIQGYTLQNNTDQVGTSGSALNITVRRYKGRSADSASLAVRPGATVSEPIVVRELHIYTGTAVQVNQDPGGLVLEAWG